MSRFGIQRKGLIEVSAAKAVGASILALAVFLLPAATIELHAELCLYGCPAGSAQTNDIIVHEIYVLSSNDSTKFADWVAYRVTAKSIGPTASRRWKADPALAEVETREPSDYRGANRALRD